MTTPASVARDYDRWLNGDSIRGRLYSLLASLPATVLVNTPAFKLHEELQLQPHHCLLDIGCGRGGLLQTLASKIRLERPPIGIDPSSVMTRLALQDTRRAPNPVALVQASGTALPFADDSIDVATCAYVLKHLDDDALLSLLSELRRVLKPGSVALVWEFAATTSEALNAWNRRVLAGGVHDIRFRNYTELSAFALEAGFDWAGNAHLRPFLFPPIPRVSLLLGKAPEGWQPTGH